MESNIIRLPETPVAPDRNLLLIDDDPVIRSSLRRLIAKHFSVCFDAADQVSALQAINGLGKGDVIVSDLELTQGIPGEGLDIAEITKQIRLEKGLLFILVSGVEKTTPQYQRVQQAISSGLIDAFHQKPYDISRLLDTIKNLMRPLP
jgi:DNA-binding NtrC family response regulator